MKRFICDCGQPLFFENTACLACHSQVGFDPATGEMRQAGPLNFCANREPLVCNWLKEETAHYCISCASTRTIPDLSRDRNAIRLYEIERAKRRLLATLLDAGLWGPSGAVTASVPLRFDFIETLDDSSPVFTGHSEGLITLNVIEADEDYRGRMRDTLGEPYRTLLGHFRHESGHYYWPILSASDQNLASFRALFGDERANYGEALERYYQAGPAEGWQKSHISAYATMHPWEDWAECWAHYFHMRDTLETAEVAGLHSLMPDLVVDPQWFMDIAQSDEISAKRFAGRCNKWLKLTITANELSFSMGQPPLYPFALTAPVLRKLFFIDVLIRNATRRQTTPMTVL